MREKENMRYINLKATDLKVSNVIMGTDSLGTYVDEKTSYDLLDFYSSKGGNVIDTAECYAHWFENGRHKSEETIGKWMKDRQNRNKTIISTKGGFYLVGEKPRLTEEDIMSDLEGSLKNLCTDYIDIYWLHRDAPSMSVEGIMDTLAKAVKQGKVRYIGVSNWTYKRIDEANRYAETMGYPLLIASQIQYSPAFPNVENNEPDLVLMNDSEYEYFKNHDMTVFAFAAQAKGFFSKYLGGGEAALSPKAYSRYLNPETVKRFDNLNEIRKKYDCSIGAAVIAAITNNYDFDTLPIIGCKNISQLKDSLSGADLVFTREEIDFIFNR